MSVMTASTLITTKSGTPVQESTGKPIPLANKNNESINPVQKNICKQRGRTYDSHCGYLHSVIRTSCPKWLRGPINIWFFLAQRWSTWVYIIKCIHSQASNIHICSYSRDVLFRQITIVITIVKLYNQEHRLASLKFHVCTTRAIPADNHSNHNN